MILNMLQSFDADRMDLNELVELSAGVRAVEKEFELNGVNMPEFVSVKSKALRREIQRRVSDEKERKLRELRARRASLKTTEEKRADLDKEIEALQAEVGAN